VTHYFYLLCFLSRCHSFGQRNTLFSPFFSNSLVY
jgi:hypothetical protein